MRFSNLGLILGLTLAAPAQQTWIVDPNGGGHFTTVVAAIAAAAPGDTILIRGGTYGQNHVIDKTLHIVGDAALGAYLNQLTILPGSGAQVAVVHVQVTMASISGIASLDDVSGLGCTVHGGTVAFTGCRFSPEFSVLGGDVAMDQCTLQGRPPVAWQTLVCTSIPGTPGILASGGTIDIANSTIVGGDQGTQCPFLLAPPLVGIQINGAVVRATRSHISGGLTSPSMPTAPVGLIAGSFQYDGSTTFGGGVQPAGTQVFLPATDGSSAAPGGTIACRVETQPGLAAMLVANLGMQARVVTVFGPLWVGAQGYVSLAFGLTDANGVLAGAIPVPASVQRGLAITFQGGALGPTASVPAAGTPVVLHVQ
jgi:hypothetical protein